MLLFNIPSASFADAKTYAATECARWNQSVDPASFISSSRRFNQSANRKLRLDCPSINDRGSRRIVSSWIRVIDRHPQDRVCAQIVAVRHLGNSFIQRGGGIRCTGRNFNSPRSIQLNTGGLSNIPSDSLFYHSVNGVPKKYFGRVSGVVSYYVNERN
jgi:hypothetical protein